MQWSESSFSELKVEELYEILRLRSEVFVVEQQCAFQDMDDKDREARHLMGRAGEGAGQPLLAYARLFGPGEYYPEASIGRVVTSPLCRGTGAGKELMREAIARAEQRWGRGPIHIGAQAYLERFYGSFAFVPTGDDYIEDGIPHRHMIRPASPAPLH